MKIKRGKEMSLRIMSPVASYKSAELQIKAGADEIYMGMEYPNFKNFNLSGRGKGANVATVKELKDIVKLCHDNNVKVNYTANTLFMVNDFENLFLEHVEQVINSDVDTLILGELGSILLVREHNFNIPLVAGVFNNVFNIEHVRFLEKLGISRVILPHELTLEEMKEIISGTDGLEYEVFGHFGCSNNNGRCLLVHESGENVNMGLLCRAKYDVQINSDIYRDVCIMDGATDCSICSLADLVEVGVDVIKIVGRDKNPFLTASITKVYRTCVDNIELDKLKRLTISQMREKILNIEPWWSYFCNENRCKYHLNIVTKSYN